MHKFDILKNKIFLKYITIMILVMIIPLGLGCISMTATMWEAKKQVTENSYSALCHIQKGLTREFYNIKQFALDLALDRDVCSYEYDIHSAKSVEELKNLSKKVNLSEGLQQFVDDVYLYMASEHIVIYEDAKYDLKQFYDIKIAPTGESMSEWMYRMQKPYYGKFEYDSNKENRTMECIQSYPVAGKFKGNVVVDINYNKIAEYYGEIYKNNRALYVLSAEDSVIYSIGDERFPLKEKYVRMSENSKATLFSSEMAFKAADGEYTFISIEDSGSVSASLQQIILFDVICIILFVFLGILLSVFAAYKISKPVMELRNIMNRYYEEKENFELDDMNEKLEALLEGNKNAGKIMNEQKQIIKNNLLKRLIAGDTSFVEDIMRELDEIGISFEKDCYEVITIDIDSRDNHDIKTSALTKYAIIKIIKEVLADVCHVEIVDDDWKEVILILNLDDIQQLHDEIYNALIQADEFISKELNVDVEINIGDVYDDIRELSRSYREAKDCAEYRMYSGTGRVLIYSKIKNKEDGYFYNTEQENEFIRNVVMGNEKAALDCLDNMILMHKDGSVLVLRCFFFNLLGTMLKILNSGNIDVAKDVDNNLGRFNDLFKCKTLDELQETIRNIVQEICQGINLYGNNKKQNLKRAMLEYIDNNYSDNAMSLEKIAGEFNLNFTYISHFFKEQIGENFIDYITRLRIERAKQLLTETKYTIAEIAVKVGYANSAVLIKNFKKVANTTPGKYRENAQNK